MFLSRVAAKILPEEITAWGGGKTYYYRSKREETDPYKEAMDALKPRKGDEDAEDYEAKEKKEAQKAPEELQEGLKKIVNKSRSKYERTEAIPKISDQTFLFQTAMNEKQHDEVRQKAAYYVTDQALLEKLAEQDLEKIKIPAINNLTDKKLILKYAEEGIPAAIRKIDDEDTLTDLIVKFGKKGGNNYGRYDTVYTDGSIAMDVRTKIKKETNLKKILEVATKKEKGEKNRTVDEKIMTATVMEIARKSKDPKILEQIAYIPEASRYYGGEEPYQRVALIKLKDDKALAKKVATDNTMSRAVRRVALKIANDSDLYEKAFESDPNFTEALDHIDNDAFLKKMYKHLLENKPKKKKAGSNDEEEDDDIAQARGMGAILPRIKDEAFLKKVVENDLKNQKYALEGIKDQKYLMELLDRLKIKDRGLRGLEENDIVSLITDQKFLKQSYENNKALLEKQYLEHKESQQGQRYKRKFSSENSDTTAKDRMAAINNIKDTDYLLKVYRGDRSGEVRRHALHMIKDTKILADLFRKEKRKTEKNLLLEELKDNKELMISLLSTEEDPEIRGWIASKLDDPEAAKKYILQNLNNASTVPSHFDDLVSSDQEWLKKLISGDKASTTWKDRLIDHVDDPKFLMKYYKANKGRLDKDTSFMYKLIDKTDDMEFLLDYAKNSPGDGHAYYTSNALDKLMPKATQEMMVDLALNAKNASVRKRAVPHVTDIKLLNKIALKDPEIAIHILPSVKDDKEFLGELLLKSKDPKVRANLVRRVKDQAVLKEVAKNDSDLAELAMHNITDEAFLKEILLETKSLPVARSILTNPNLPIEDVKKFAFATSWNLGGGAYNAVSDFAKRIWTRLVENDQITNKDIDALSLKDEHLANRAGEALIDVLEEKKHFDLLKHWALHGSEYWAKKAFKAVRSVEFAEEVRKKAKDPEVKKEALLWINPADLKPDMVADFTEALDSTDEPRAVSLDLIHKAYTIGTEDEQDVLAKRVPDRLLNERHKKDMSEEDFHYLKPRTSYQEQKGVIKKQDHPVVELPQQELLRLLVGLAR